jgi:integrase/recombinase XerD
MLMKFAVKDFRDDREYKNLSPKSISSYLLTLEEFQKFCFQQEIIDVNDITASIVKSYLLYCQNERKNNPSTKNTKLHTLKIFFNFLEQSEVITTKQNPCKKLGYAMEEIKIEVFSDHQIKQMLGYFQRLKYRDKSFYAYRDYTTIVFLLGTGVRLGEFINLKWSQVDFKNGLITVWGKKRQQSSIPLTDKLIKELCEYRLFCERHSDILPDFVFTNREGLALTTNAVKCIFKRSLQRMLRHSDLRMTQRYLAIWGTALKEQNDKYNPLNNLEI